ncbi:hypothetical protein KY284_019967 [Solanum tuberosum]|nr:hypothetical protein KY284_019967 [Solanum tuberosum]
MAGLDEVEVMVVVVDIIWVMVNFIIPWALFNVNSNTQMAAFIAQPNTVSEPTWYPDFGATNHLSNDLNNVTNRGDYSGNEQIMDRGTGKVLLEGRVEDGLYKLLSIDRSDLRSFNKPQDFLVTKPTLDVWHSRLGVCAFFQQGKSHEQPFSYFNFIVTPSFRPDSL